MPFSERLSRLTSLDWRRELQSTERSLWRLAAQVLFVVAFLLVALASVLVSPVLLAILLAFLASQMIRVVLPTGDIREAMRSYWTGEAGDRWRSRSRATGQRISGLPRTLGNWLMAGSGWVRRRLVTLSRTLRRLQP